MNVVVVGGGVSGLAAARALVQGGANVTVLEASKRCGGLLQTERTDDGFVIEHGPESIITTKPAGIGLMHALGLEDELLKTKTDARGAYVVTRGELVRIPAGFSVVAPTHWRALIKSGVLDSPVRPLLDRVIPGTPREDDSLGAFVRRRFGVEVLERLAQPLAGGIYGADPEVLSLRGTMPRFLDAEGPGGVAKAIRATIGDNTAGARYGMFVSLRRGMQQLAETLVADLDARASLRTGQCVTSLRRTDDGYVLAVAGPGGEREEVGADAVVLALPAPRSAAVAASLDDELSAELGAIRYGSAAAVTLAYDDAALPAPFDAYGFVVPAIERRPILACTYSSAKWGGRAPDGAALVRVFFGGHARPDAVEMTDDQLLGAARRSLRNLVGIHRPPEFVRFDRWPGAMPRYHVGHLRRVDRIEARTAAHPGLELAGAAFRGVGIPDSIASGQRAAAKILASGATL